MGFFDNAVSVVIDNKIVQSIKTTDGGVIYEKGNGTFLTIDVPLNLVYSDAFNITGTLKDSNQNGLSGETVKLKVGSTVVDSTTTTTGGAYSFTQTPVATGNHSFQVVYEGSVTYNASQSSIVNRVVGKETTVLTVTNPSDNYMTYDSNISFTGRLTDDEGNPLSGKTISINDTYVTHTVTTQSDGSFSTSKAYGSGTWNFTISFGGDSNYTSSSVNRGIIIREHDYDISISANKSILSYSDEDSCTVTCLLTDNHVAIGGETLSYVIKHGATVLDSGSDTTDANGEISFTYSATGVGDVTVEVDYGILLQETYEVQDCFYWNDNEIQITGTNKHTLYDSDLSVALPTNAEISFDVNTVTTSTSKDYRWWFMSKSLFRGMTYPSDSLYFDKKPSYILYNQRANGSDKYPAKQFTASTYATIKYVKNGTTVKVYVDDTLMFEDTVSWIENYSDYTISAMKWSGSETMKMKNVKFKALW